MSEHVAPAASAPSLPQPDTVDNAIATPEKHQPYEALGLKPDEYEQIKQILGRRPTSGELAMYSVMWSEHCSYKSSQGAPAAVRPEGQRRDARAPHGRHGRERRRRRHRRGLGGHVQDREPQPPELHRAVPGRGDRRRRHRARHHLDGRAPRRRHGCAAIRRHRPSRHGPRRCPGSSAASASTATASGSRTSAARPGSTRSTRPTPSSMRSPSEPSATKTCTSPTPAASATKSCCSAREQAETASAGASILASDTFSEGGPTKRPAVQVGDPFAEKVLIECCLELYRDGLVEGIQDLGAAGISCATSELASNGDGGMVIDLDAVLLRDPSLTAEEILMSESQERMMAIVEPCKLDALPRRDRQVGRRDERARRGHRHGPPRHPLAGREDRRRRPATVAIDGPVYNRPMQRTRMAGCAQRGFRARSAPRIRRF